MRAFLIVSGEYDNYHVWAVSTDKLVAYRVVGHLNDKVEKEHELFGVEEVPIINSYEDGVSSFKFWQEREK